MAEVVAEHRYMYGKSFSAGRVEVCACGWETGKTMMAKERGKEFAAHQEAMLAANGYGKLPESVAEWASAFRATGARYNYHRTQAEAEDFVKSMNEVDADMVVITRQHTPATSTEWRPQ